MTECSMYAAYKSSHFCFHVHTNDRKVLDFIGCYLDCIAAPHRGKPCFELHYSITYRDRQTLQHEDRVVHSDASHSKVSASEYRVDLAEKAASVTVNVAAMQVTAALYSLDHSLGAIDLVLFYPCRMLLAYHNWLYIHAAHVQSAAHDFIFIGPSGIGKSSLAYSLAAQAGFAQRADDIVFIHADETRNYCLPLPTRIGFRNKALEAKASAAQESTLVYGGKKRFAVPAPLEMLQDVTARASVFIIPEYDEHIETLKLEPIVNRQSFAEAIGDATLPMCDINLWPQQYKDACLTLTMFIRCAEIYRLRYNDRLLDTVASFGAGRWAA